MDVDITILQIESVVTDLTIEEPINILSISESEQGPPGPPGPPGLLGILYYEYQVSTNGEQVISLSAVISRVVSLFINGLPQRRSEYSFSGPQVTLPNTLNVVSGDWVEILYIV